MRKVLYILGELDDHDLQWLSEAGTSRRVPAETRVIEQGKPCESLFIVVDGEFDVRVPGRDGVALGVGEVFGDISLLDSRPASATITASRDSTIFAVSHAHLRGKLGADQGFASRFYRALCIFLANRLTRADTVIGVGTRMSLGEAELAEDEISPEALGHVALAGARFEWFLERIRNA